MFLQQSAGCAPLVPSNVLSANHYGLLRPLARKQHCIVWFGPLESVAQSFPPIGHTNEIPRLPAAFLSKAGGYLIDNDIRVLSARVLIRKDNEIGEFSRDAAHSASAGGVSLTSAAEDRPQTPHRDRPKDCQHATQRLWCGSNVHYHPERLAGVDYFQATRHTRE